MIRLSLGSMPIKPNAQTATRFDPHSIRLVRHTAHVMRFPSQHKFRAGIDSRLVMCLSLLTVSITPTGIPAASPFSGRTGNGRLWAYLAGQASRCKPPEKVVDFKLRKRKRATAPPNDALPPLQDGCAHAFFGRYFSRTCGPFRRQCSV